MQRKIGEVFDCTLENGEIVSLQVIEAEGCNKCIFQGSGNCVFTKERRGDCYGVSFIKIEKQESDTFNSQKEIWQYLSESEENKVVDNAGGIIGFKNGRLIEFNDGKITNLSLRNFQDWKKYTPPKTIMVNGVEIEAPLRSLDGVEVVYVPDFATDIGCSEINIKQPKRYSSQWEAQDAIKKNTAFATPEAAIACHDALLKGIIVPQ